MSQSNRRVWRKHVFVLLVSTRTQWLQVVFSLLVFLFGGLLLQAVADTPATFLTKLALAASVCGFWTAFHLTTELRSKPVSQDVEKTPLARRQALLAKISDPIRWPIAIVGGMLTAGIGAGIIIASFMDPVWIAPLAAVYYAFLGLWILVEVVDWYNDQYILTEDRIIDITRLPVIYEQRSEAPLGMVQNATTSQRGLGVLLNYGNVQVETAGYSRPILFENVWRPKLIQEAIFHRIDQLGSNNRERTREELANQTLRWFEAYHSLAGGIRDIVYDEVVSPGRPFRVRWVIQGPAGRPYRTWMSWDLVSRNESGEYACWARPEGRPAYTDEREVDGTGSGMHHIRGLRMSQDTGSMFFRIALLFEGQKTPLYSPEMVIAIREPAQS